MPTATKTRTPRATSRANRHHALHWQDEILVRVLEFAAVWVMALVVVPSVGELMWLAWGGSEWHWVILAVAVFAAGPIPLPVLGRRSAATELPDGTHLQSPVEIRGVAWVGLSVITYHEAAPRGRFARWRAAVTVAAALLAVGVTAQIGVVGHSETAGWWLVQPWVNLYVTAAFILCVSWNIPRTEAVRGAGGDDHRQDTGAGALAEALGVSKPVNPIRRTTSDDGVRHEIVLDHPGVTVAEIAHGADKLVSAAGLPPTAARVVGNPDNAARTKLTLVMADVLRDPQPWPGPSRPGASIAEPCRLGVYEDGADLEILRPGDPATGRPSISVLSMGTPNAGKTEAELLEIAEDVTRPDVAIWWVDTAKGAQTIEDIRPAIDWPITDKRQAPIFAKAIRYQINYRSGALALLAKRFKVEGRQWTPDAWKHLHLPYLKVVFEEYGDVGEVFGNDIVAIGEQVRSTGISLHVSLQRATGDRINTSLRSSLGAGWAFGIKDASDANLVLSSTTLGMGANPGAWSNLKPGMNYLEASHVDQERWAMPGRTFKPIPVAVLHWHIAWWSQLMARLDQGSIDAMPKDVRKVYDERQRCDLMGWVEGHGVDLLHPPAGTPRAAVEAVQNVAVPRLAARTEHPVAAPGPAPEPEPAPAPEHVEVTVMTEQDVETMLRDTDRTEAVDAARAFTDPDFPLPATTATTAPADPDGDPMPLGDDDDPEPTMTPDEALVDAFREIFDRHPGADKVDTDTSELTDLLAARGFFHDSNPRPFLIDRLAKLADNYGHVERGERGRGPRASTWVVLREVLNPPTPDTDGD